MSIQDIANYVKQTPGNTNPSVITSMVKSEVGEYVEEASNEALRKLGIKTDRKETWLLPEQSFVMLPIMDGAEEGVFGGTFTPVGETLPEELYFVINGVVYKSKKQMMEHNADTVGWYGNAALFSPDDFEESPEPFFAMLNIGDSSFVGGIINPDTGSLEHAGTTHTFGIYAYTENITPIDKKWLPGACLPVVTLYTKPGESMVPLTEVEAAQMDALNGLPCIFVFKSDEITTITSHIDHLGDYKTVPCIWTVNDGRGGYRAVLITKYNDAWYAQYIDAPIF